MKVATVRALAAFLFGLIALAPLRGAAAAADSKTRSHTAIFVANSYSVTAYPTGSRRGDVMPIALTTDMTAPGGIARDASGRIYITNTATNTVTVYAAKSSGNVPPIAVIGGSNTRLVNPDGIALDASGKIYVLNHTEYPKGTSRSIRRSGPTPVFSTRPRSALSREPKLCLMTPPASHWTRTGTYM
jgi:hypothetical protein